MSTVPVTAGATTGHAAAPARDRAARRVPPAGGFNATLLGLEVRRMLRNRRTLVFTLVMPCVFFLIFGLQGDFADQAAGRGNVTGYVMVSMALYGAALATTTGGSMVSMERALGWSRQLRLTPLTPLAYVLTKMLTALVLGGVSIAAVYLLGAVTGATMPGWAWALTGVTVLVGSLIFAAFGLFMGYLLPTENVMQLLSFALLLFAFGGGVFIPLSQMSATFQDIAAWTPMYGINGLVHVPFGETFHATMVINAAVWLSLFVTGAVWRFRRDTARV